MPRARMPSPRVDSSGPPQSFGAIRGLWRLVLMEVSLFHHQRFVPARPKGLKFSKLPLEVSLATSFHTQLEMSS